MSFELTKRQSNILEFLRQKGDWVTGKELSSFLGVSDRTIRSDLEVLRKFIPYAIESSNKFGYRLSSDFDMVHNVIELLSPIERAIDIIKSMTVCDSPVDLYNLAEKYYVSESTILSDINQIRIHLNYSQSSLELRREGDFFFFDGKLELKVLFLNYMFKKHFNSLTSQVFETYFNISNIDSIQSRIIEVLLRNEVYSRYLSFDVLMVNLLVVYERSQTGQIPDEDKTISKDNKKCISQMFKVIEGKTFKENLYNYGYLLDSCFRNVKEMEDIEERIRSGEQDNRDFRNFFKQTLAEATEKYAVEFNLDGDTYIDLEVHTHIAIFRAVHNIRISNPIKKQMKNEHPFLFDVAFFISKKVGEKYNIYLNSEEVSFIVSHLINMTRQNIVETELRSKLIVGLITLEGSAVSRLLEERISFLGYKEVEVLTISSLYELRQKETQFEVIDVLIATSPIMIRSREADVVISPQVTITDEFQVSSYINKEITRMKEHNFDILFKKFFDENHFYQDLNFQSVEEVCRTLCEPIIENGIISNDYLESVLERETMLTTSFPTGIALPHGTRLNAKESKVMTCFFKTPMIWGGNLVKIVFLFVIRGEDTKYLKEFYRLIADFALSQDKIAELYKQKGFSNFKKTLRKFYTKLF